MQLVNNSEIRLRTVDYVIATLLVIIIVCFIIYLYKNLFDFSKNNNEDSKRRVVTIIHNELINDIRNRELLANKYVETMMFLSTEMKCSCLTGRTLYNLKTDGYLRGKHIEIACVGDVQSFAQILNSLKSFHKLSFIVQGQNIIPVTTTVNVSEESCEMANDNLINDTKVFVEDNDILTITSIILQIDDIGMYSIIIHINF